MGFLFLTVVVIVVLAFGAKRLKNNRSSRGNPINGFRGAIGDADKAAEYKQTEKLKSEAPVELMGHAWRPSAAPPGNHLSEAEVKIDARETAVLPRGGRIKIRGRVHNITELPDKAGPIYQFRVDAYNKDGQRISYPVELRGRSIGLLGEGDLVSFSAKVKPGEALRIKSLRNLTGRGSFRRRGASMSEIAKLITNIPGMIIYVVLDIVVFVGFVALVIGVITLLGER